jgi:hypothetical protein
MSRFLFWNTFPPALRRFYAVGLVLLLSTLVFFGIAYARGLDNVLHWDVLSELGEVPFVFDELKSKNEEVKITATAYTLTEQFVAPAMTINMMAANGFWAFFVLGTLLGLTALTTLRRTWYLVGMAVFLALVASLNLDALFGRANQVLTIGVIVAFGGLSYFFQAFRPDVALWKRYLGFLLLAALLDAAGFIALEADPLEFHLALASYALPAALVLAVGFTFWVSIEIVYGLLVLATSQRSTNGLTHFSVLSAVYLGNVLLVLLHNTRYLDWDILYLSPFLLLVVSAVLGIWGLRQREPLVADSLPFVPAGALLYLGLGVVTFATVGYAFATANDPLVESLEDASTYGHLVMGGFFFLYVFFNFGPLFKEGLEIHKVAFKPQLFQLYHVRGLSLILIVFLLSQRNYFPVFQSFAGYYNGLGDLATTTEDYRLAETYYRQALSYERQNHKSNYALASLALVQGDNAAAGAYFRQALLKQPSPYAYAGLARSLGQEDLFFDALFALQEGTRKFPQSGELNTNIAAQFARSQVADSAFFYLERAKRSVSQPGVPEANELAYRIRFGPMARQRQAAGVLTLSEYGPARVNQLALKNLFGVKTDSDAALRGIPADSTLSLTAFAQLQNETLNALRQGRGAGVPAHLRNLENREENAGFVDELQYLRTLTEYYVGDKLAAFDLASGRVAADSTAGGGRWRQTLTALLENERGPGQNFQSLEDFGSLKTAADYERALRRQPFNPAVLERATAFFNQKKRPERGYNALLNALRYQPAAPALLRLYSLQALEMRLPDYADEAARRYQEVATVSERGAFVPVYQAKRALIEKERSDFQ